MKSKHLLFLFPVVAMILSGCGRGGSSTSAPAPTTTGTPTTSGTTSVDPVKPSSIEVNSSKELSLKEGELSQIDAKVLPENASDKGIIYEVSDPAVISVSESGLIDALAVGSAKVILKASGDQSISEEVNVTVSEAGYADSTKSGATLVKSDARLVNGAEIVISGYCGKEPVILGTDVTTSKASLEHNIINDDNAGHFKLVKASDYYALMLGDKYLASKGNSNGIQLVDTLSGNAKFNISIAESGEATIVAQEGSRNKLYVNPNSGTPMIRFYGEQDYALPLLYAKDGVSVDSISITKEPTKTKYLNDEAFATDGMEVTANMSDGSSKIVTDYEVSPTGALEAGTTQVKITYEGKEATQNVEVRAKVLSSLEVTSAPTKQYKKGQSLSKSDITVKATYNANEEGFTRVNEDFKDYNISPASFEVSGAAIAVTLSVNGSSVTTSFNVVVLDISLSSIEMSATPKTSYYAGEKLDATGLKIKAVYSDASEEVIDYASDTFTLSPAVDSVLEQEDTGNVIVTYGGKSTSYAISVAEDSVTSITANVSAAKTKYMVGDTLDVANIVVKAQYHVKAEAVITNYDVYEGTTLIDKAAAFAEAQIGSHTYKFVYGTHEASTTYTFSVEAYNGVKLAYEAAMDLEEGQTSTASYNIAGKIMFKPGNSLIVQDGDYAIDISKTGQSTAAMELGKKAAVSCQVTKKNGTAKTVTIPNTDVTITDDAVTVNKKSIDGAAAFASASYQAILDVKTLVLAEKKTVSDASDTSIKVHFDGETTEFTMFIKKSLYSASAAEVLNSMDIGGKFEVINVYKTMYSNKDQVALGTETVVTDKTVYPVETISVTPASASITTSGSTNTVQLSAVLNEGKHAPTDNQVVWSVASGDAASVSATGLVTGVKAGQAVIRATAHDGSGVYGESTITVTDSVVHVTGVSLSPTSISDLQVGKTSTLVATVAPTDATDKSITWASSDETVATVANGVVTAVATGSATITVKTTDGNYTATCAVTVVPRVYEGLIAEGSYVIKSTNNSTNYYLKSNGVATPTATASIGEGTLFEFKLVDDNKYSIKSGDNYLYATATNNGMRVGPTADYWIVSASGDDFYFKDTTNNRYLSLYNAQDFRCYTSTSSGNPKINVSAQPDATAVVLSKSSTSIAASDSETITASLNGKAPSSGSFSWSVTSGSDKVSIEANGNSCKITGSVEGTAVITCSYGALTSASISVTITAAASAYTLTAAVGGSTSNGSEITASTSVSSIFSSGSAYVSSISNISKAYYASKNALKLGTGDAQGTLTLALASAGQVVATTIKVTAKRYSSSTAATLSINGSTAQALTADYAEYTYTIGSAITSIAIVASKGVGIQSIVVAY